MVKLISTRERVFICICGSSGSGKTRLIYSMLTCSRPQGSGIFHPPFYKIVYIYKYWQSIFDCFKRDVRVPITFCLYNGNSDSDDDSFVKSLIDEHGSSSASVTRRCLLIFDDSCDKILQCEAFSDLATAGRHKNLDVIFIKHNLYQKGKFSVTIDKNTTHVVITKSPRIGKQLKILGSELLETANGKFLLNCYQDAMKIPYGHFLIDLTPTCPDALRFCSNLCGDQKSVQQSGKSVVLPTQFYLPPNIFKRQSPLPMELIDNDCRMLMVKDDTTQNE